MFLLRMHFLKARANEDYNSLKKVRLSASVVRVRLEQRLTRLQLGRDLSHVLEELLGLFEVVIQQRELRGSERERE